jgi:voltage-gated potassium channel
MYRSRNCKRQGTRVSRAQPETPPYAFQALLTALLLMLVITPTLLRSTWGTVMFELALSTVLVLSVYAISHEKKLWIPAASLAVPSVCINWVVMLYTGHPILRQTSAFLNVLLFLYVPAVLIRYLFRKQKISIDLIFGAMCGYLLLGMMWTLIYTLLEWVEPGSFVGLTKEGVEQARDGLLVHHFQSFLYYSFVTLTTVGYGDVLPQLSQARAFAILEALMGQLYLTVLLGRLIGVHLQGKSAR